MSDIEEQGPVWSLLDAAVGIPSGTSINFVDLLFVRSVQPNPQITTITFEGDDTSEDQDEATRYDVVVACDKQDFDAIQQIFGKTKVTGISGEDWSMYMGDDDEVAGPNVQLRYTLKAKDQSAAPAEAYTLRYTWLYGNVKLVRPQNAEWKAKHIMQLNFSFQKTSVDPANQALASVPTGGAVYRLGRLT